MLRVSSSVMSVKTEDEEKRMRSSRSPKLPMEASSSSLLLHTQRRGGAGSVLLLFLFSPFRCDWSVSTTLAVAFFFLEVWSTFATVSPATHNIRMGTTSNKTQLTRLLYSFLSFSFQTLPPNRPMARLRRVNLYMAELRQTAYISPLCSTHNLL